EYCVDRQNHSCIQVGQPDTVRPNQPDAQRTSHFNQFILAFHTLGSDLTETIRVNSDHFCTSMGGSIHLIEHMPIAHHDKSMVDGPWNILQCCIGFLTQHLCLSFIDWVELHLAAVLAHESHWSRGVFLRIA